MKCRSCFSRNMEMLWDLGDQAWGNNFISIQDEQSIKAYPLQIFFCIDCSMVQLGFTVPKEVMFVDHAYLSGTTKSLKAHFVSVAEEIVSRKSIQEQHYILDIGGNDGTFLEYFSQNGKNVLNIDSGRLQAKQSNKNGVPCLNTFFNEQAADHILATKGYAEVIHGSGILFHLEQLHGAFNGIKKLLNPTSGMLVAEFIYLPEMLKNLAYDQIYHEHLLYYTLHSFQALLKQFDLEIYDCYIKPIHGGSCVAFISHSGLFKRSKGLQDMMDFELKNRLNSIETYHTFVEKVKDNCRQLVALIKSLRKEGKTIFALGAPVKGSTMINYCGLTEKDIECAVEINKYKCGTYFPGTRIPVYHENDVGHPDVYLLLSWNFKNEILEKIKEYRSQGGKIIIPIPKVELI